MHDSSKEQTSKFDSFFRARTGLEPSWEINLHFGLGALQAHREFWRRLGCLQQSLPLKTTQIHPCDFLGPCWRDDHVFDSEFHAAECDSWSGSDHLAQHCGCHCTTRKWLADSGRVSTPMPPRMMSKMLDDEEGMICKHFCTIVLAPFQILF